MMKNLQCNRRLPCIFAPRFSSLVVAILFFLVSCSSSTTTTFTYAQPRSLAINVPLLLFDGRVLNDLGEPLEGAQVQFWHTDPNGNYNHPLFVPTSDLLVQEFQYFGTATTDSNGTFQFRTYRPGIYSQRPITHIHFKVWWKNQDVLTSQFYFRDEGRTQYPDALQLDLTAPTFITDDSNSEILVVTTQKDIIVDLGLGGSEPITPSQTSGPFYPTVNFFGFDSDMTIITTNELEGTQPPTTTNAPAPVDDEDSMVTKFPSSMPSFVPGGMTSTTGSPMTTPPTNAPTTTPSLTMSLSPTTSFSFSPTTLFTTMVPSTAITKPLESEMPSEEDTTEDENNDNDNDNNPDAAGDSSSSSSITPQQKYAAIIIPIWTISILVSISGTISLVMG